MLNKIRLTALLFLTTTSCFAHHKIICLVTPPRSLSVAFLRMMEARQDFTIFHEPSQFVFNLAHSPAEVQQWFNPDAPRTYDQVKELLLTASKHGNVFVKEMSFAVVEWLTNDEQWLKNPDVFFVFMVRDPHHTVISFYKKFSIVFDEASHQLYDVIGYKALYEIVVAVQKSAANKPYIIHCEDLYADPENIVRQFCDAVNIPFLEHALSWDDLGETFRGWEQWHEIKHKQMTQHWHDNAIRSTGFGKPSSYAVDEKGEPTFQEIEHSEHRAFCKQVYEHHLYYYRKLLAEFNKHTSRQ